MLEKGNQVLLYKTVNISEYNYKTTITWKGYRKLELLVSIGCDRIGLKTVKENKFYIKFKR